MKITAVEPHGCHAQIRWVLVKVVTDQPAVWRGPVRDNVHASCLRSAGGLEDFYETAADDAKRLTELVARQSPLASPRSRTWPGSRKVSWSKKGKGTRPPFFF